MTSQLLIRADASPDVGVGHVMRCLALAQSWQDLDLGSVHIACLEIPHALERRLQANGISIHRLAEPDRAADVAAIASDIEANWIVVDGYRFDEEYHRGVRACGARVLVVDDFGTTGSWDADILLDQNMGASFDQHYGGARVQGPVLMGSNFCLLRREFRTYSPSSTEATSGVLNILVLAGGGAGGGFRSVIIPLLEEVASPIQARVVVGPADSVESSTTPVESERIKVLVDVRDMPAQMEWADVAVSASGSTAWELMFMGVPSVLVPVADNQKSIARMLHEEGAVVSVDDCTQIGEQLNALVNDREKRQLLRKRAQSMIDGLGAQRVITEMMALENSSR